MSLIKPNEESTAEAKPADTAAPVDSIEELDLASWLPPVEGAAEVNMRRPLATLKHKRVRNFTVGNFTFVDHLLNLYSMDEVREFQGNFKGLELQDQLAIVTLNLEAIAASEQSFGESSPIRGNLVSKAIKDPKLVQ